MATAVKKLAGITLANIKRVSNIPAVADELHRSYLFDDANLKAYYRFNSGALTTDSKGSNTLTNNNSVSENASGKFGYAADGGATNTNKFLRIDSNIGIAGNSSMTISLWLKMNTELASGGSVFAQHFSQTGSKRYINVYYDYNGGTRRIVAAFSSANAFFNGSLGTSNWHHIALVRDVGANTGVIYLDGVAGTPVTLGTTELSIDRVSILGANADSFLSGLLDDVAFFDRALTATEIAKVYSNNIKKIAGVTNV